MRTALPQERPLERDAHYTIAAVAQLYGVTRRTLYQWIEKGLIPEPIVRAGSKYRTWHANQLPLIAQRTKAGVKGVRQNHD